MNFFQFLNKLTPRQILMMSGAVAVLIFALIYSTLSKIEESKEEEVESKVVQVSIPRKEIIVASMDIPAHAVVTSRMIKMESVPENVVPVGAITEPRLVIGHPTTVDIFSGDIFTKRKIFEDISQAGFIGDIPPDCRAISVPINDVSAVSGFIEPGDYVDILIVSDSEDQISSRILLQNVLLLAIGSTSENRKTRTDSEGNTVSNNSNAGNSGAATATLALHPNEILRLTANMQTGNINLILRPFKPAAEIIEDTEYRIYKREPETRSNEVQTVEPVNNYPVYTQTFDTFEDDEPITMPVRKKKPTIEVIRGTTVSEEHG